MKILIILCSLIGLNAFAHELSLKQYVDMQESLAADDFNKSLSIHKMICDKDGAGFKKDYTDCSKKFKNIEELRVSYKKLSEYYLAHGNKTEMKSLMKVHCPMYPGPWLQRPGKIANPYYGKSMLECGEKI